MNVENKINKIAKILKEKGFIVYKKGGKEPGVFYAKEGDSRIGFVYSNNGYIYDRIKIVDLLVDYKITKLIVGYNKGWKQNVDIGKKNNQKFTQIPFARLVSYLEYKCELVGIEIVIHEESYTSKCDSLAFEKIGKHENYLGKRKNRGLFQSSVGKLINADVNGALNIMRKVVGDSCESIRRIIDRGLLFNPVRITNVFC